MITRRFMKDGRWAMMCAAATSTALFLAAAPAARADDQSFLNDLHTNNVYTGPADVVPMGHYICTQIRGGLSPADAARMTQGIDMPRVVDFAQHDLCPDTLPR